MMKKETERVGKEAVKEELKTQFVKVEEPLKWRKRQSLPNTTSEAY
jgi:hypothetical protein